MPANNASLRPAFDSLKLLSTANMQTFFETAKKF